MEIHVLTLFPGIFHGPLDESILKRAQAGGHVSIQVHNVRDFTEDKHKTADDTPYGGGIGMVMKAEPIQKGLDALLVGKERLTKRVVLLSPQGRVFSQEDAKQFAAADLLALICGRYEGVDDRIRHGVTDEISLGDFVLTGGEIGALAIIDATVRFIPGVIGQTEAPYQDSFAQGLLEFPQFTKPETFRGHAVPEVLRSGHHEKIQAWRRRASLARTLLHRSDLFATRERETGDETHFQSILEEIGKGHA